MLSAYSAFKALLMLRHGPHITFHQHSDMRLSRLWRNSRKTLPFCVLCSGYCSSLKTWKRASTDYTYSMFQNSSTEDNSRSDRPFMELRFVIVVSLVPNPSWMNPVHTLTSYPFKNQFNIVLALKYECPTLSLHLFIEPPNRATCLVHPFSLPLLELTL
jgi:hypothetical protein